MPSSPRVVVVTGRPGAGKTTLSRALAQSLGVSSLHRDQVKEELAGASPNGASPIDNATATNEFFQRLGHFIASSTRVVADTETRAQSSASGPELIEPSNCMVVDAAFQHAVWESRLSPFTPHAEFRIVVCTVALEVARARRCERALAVPARRDVHFDPALEQFLESGFWPADEPYAPPRLPFPTLAIETTEPTEVSVSRIREWLTRPPDPR